MNFQFISAILMLLSFSMSCRTMHLVLYIILLLVWLSSTAEGDCDGYHCRVSPGSFNHLQEMLQSNRVVEFEKGDYHITPSSGGGFIQVQDVVNLTIIGQGARSLILCLPNATLGFYFNNACNVTILDLSISNCSAPIPKPLTNVLLQNYPKQECSLIKHIPQNYESVSSSFLIVDSNHVTFSNNAINNSTGFAVIAINTFKYAVTPANAAVHRNSITVEDSELSLNTQGSLLLYRINVILNRNVHTKNTISLFSFGSELTLSDVHISQSPMILIASKGILLSGSLNLDQSPTCVINSTVLIESNNNIMSGFNGSTFIVALLSILDSTFEVTSNSSIVFKENDLAFFTSSFFAFRSCIDIQKYTKVIFVNNTASTYAGIFNALMCNVTISDNAQLIFINNTASNVSAVFGAQTCNVTIKNNASLIFAWNFATNHTSIFAAHTSIWNVYSNASVIFQNNKAQNTSFIVFLNNSNFNSYEDTRMVFSNNEMKEISAGIYLLSSNISVKDSISHGYLQNTTA